MKIVASFIILLILPFFVMSQNGFKVAIQSGTVINTPTTTNTVSISPAVANIGQSLTVMITGSNKHFTQVSENRLYFFLSQASGMNVVSPTSIIVINDSTLQVDVTVPPYILTGYHSLYLYNYIHGSIEFTSGLFINGVQPPYLTSASPSVAINGQTLDVTITGTNTHFSQASGTTIDFKFNQASGTTVVNSINIINDNSLQANITVPINTFTGKYPISVFNSIDGNMLTDSIFHVNGLTLPSLVSVSPAVANNGETLNVTITGANTHFNQASGTTVNFNFNQASGTVVNSVTVINDNTIQANITVPPNTYTGDYSVSTYNSIDGYLPLYNAFHVNGTGYPLASISPAVANNGETLNVTLTLPNANFNQASGASVYFDLYQASGIVVNSVTVINAQTLLANITVSPNTYTGDYTITTYNPIGNYVRWSSIFLHINGLTPPSLLSISPSVANNGQTLNVTITGANTHFSQASGTTVSFSFIQGSSTVVNSVNIIDDNTLIANITIPHNTYTGDYRVNVYNSIDGYNGLYNAFHVNGITPPSIVSIDPQTAMPGQRLDVTITGSQTHFTQASGTSLIFSSFQASSTVINSMSILNDTIIIANITVPENELNGVSYLSVYNTIDQYLGIPFYIFDNCFSYYTTNYNATNNVFSLTLDSITSALGARFNWDFGDGTTYEGETPTHNFLKDTIYNVCLKITTATNDSCTYCHKIGKDANGPVFKQTATGFSINVFKYNSITGLSEIGNSEDLSLVVYPNPAKDAITISSKQFALLHNTILSIYNIEGQLVLQQAVSKDVVTLNISDLSNGIYLLSMNSDEAIKTIKFVKQ